MGEVISPIPAAPTRKVQTTPMATNTRNRARSAEADAPAETDKSDVEPEAEPEVPVSDESPETDTEATPTEETDIPTLPADFTPTHPLVADLYEAVLAAEKAMKEPTPIRDFVDAADKMFATPTGFSIVAVLPEADIEANSSTFDAFKSFVDNLRPKVEVRDRADGDDLAVSLPALLRLPRGGIVAETDKQAIPILSARWAATAPKGSKGTGSPRTGESDIPTLASVWETDNWRVKYECGTCKKTFSTRKDNLNSARNECIKHSRTHGLNKSEGTNDYKELTEGLYRNGLGNPTYKGDHAKADELVDSIQRGGWRIFTVK